MNNNDPAFPMPAYRDAHGWHNDPVYGLTKREEFAKAAMQGLLVNSYLAASGDASAFNISMNAIQYADALLAELAKEVK